MISSETPRGDQRVGAAREQAEIGADRDHEETIRDIAVGIALYSGENAANLAGFRSHIAHGCNSRLHMSGVWIAHRPQIGRQVAGTDEQHVDAVHRRDLGCVGEPRLAFDLHREQLLFVSPGMVAGDAAEGIG